MRRAKQHRSLLAVVCLGAALRATAWWTHGAALAFYGDSFVYFQDRDTLRPGLFHPLGYPTFLRLLDLPMGVGTVTAVQHLLGLAIGVAVYALLVRLGTRPWLATLGIAGLLLDAYQVNIEQFIMAETLSEVLLVLLAIAVLWRERPSVPVCAAAGALICLAALTRTVLVVVLLPVLVYAVVRRWGAVRLVVVVGMAVLPLASYAIWFHGEHGRFALDGTSGRLLYARVQPYLPCEPATLPVIERPLCVPPVPLTGPTSSDPSAGGGLLYYAWNSASPLKQVRPPRGQTVNDVAQRYAVRQILRHPLTYAATAGSSFIRLFSWSRQTRAGDWPIESWRFAKRTDPPRLHVLLLRAHDDQRPLPNVTRLAPQPARPPADALAAYQRWGYVPGPLLASGLILPVAYGLRRRRAPPLEAAGVERWTREGTAMGWLAVSGFLLLLVPAATSGVDYRYVLPALPVLLPAGVLAVEMLLRLLRSATRGIGLG